MVSVGTVTVTIPYRQCGLYVTECVESILAQTYCDMRVIVVNDGDIPPADSFLGHLKDERMIVLSLGERRGRYFADAVVLEATSDDYVLVQDADDWSDPRRLEILVSVLKQHEADFAISAERECAVSGVRNWPFHIPDELPRRLQHIANHHGLFRVELLRSVGGFYGGFEIGYDTLLMSLLLMAGRSAYINEPLIIDDDDLAP